MIHYSKLTRGLMASKLYAYNDEIDITISVYQGGENIDILNGDCRNDEHVTCDYSEFMESLFVALKNDHKNKIYV